MSVNGKQSGPREGLFGPKPWRCRLGFHTDPLSQGVVGFCMRPGCHHFVRVYTNRRSGIWTRYVEKPNEADRPRGSR